MSPLDRLKQMAMSWGGSLVEVTPAKFRELETTDQLVEAPYTSGVGVDFDAKAVYYTKGISVVTLLHELGHAFASADRPEDASELDFFGWEFVLAKHLGLEEEWLDDQVNYSVPFQDGYSSFRRIPLDDQRSLLEASVARGKRLGSIVDGLPVTVR